MLIVNTSGEGRWFKHTVRGETIELKIRPLTMEVYNSLRRKYRTTRMERDPSTRKMVKVEEYNDDLIAEDLTDYLLESFRGIGVDKETPLEVTSETKKMVMEIPPAEGEQSIADFVYEKAREIAALTEGDLEDIEKN